MAKFLKSWVALGLIICLALPFGLQGCSSTSNGSGGEALTIMGYDSNLSNIYMKRIFKAYEEKTGKKIKLVAMANDAIDDKAMEAFDKGEGPDILMHFNNGFIATLPPQDYFLDLTSQPWVSDVTKGALAYAQTSDGQLYGLPFWESSISGCYYNKTLLKKLGLKPATTQQEFDRLCAALKSAGYTPIDFGDEDVDAKFQFGLDPIFADAPALLTQLNQGEITLKEIPGVVSMVEWLKKAYDNGWFGDTTKLSYKQLSKPLSNGTAMMVYIWDTWFDTDYTGSSYSASDFGLMPIFMGSSPKGTYEGGNLNMMFVNKKSANTEEALDFLKFCATPENYNMAFEGVSTVSVFKNQTTNKQSPMVVEAEQSIKDLARPSTAQPKILGYQPREISKAIWLMFKGTVDVQGCLDLMQQSLVAGRGF